MQTGPEFGKATSSTAWCTQAISDARPSHVLTGPGGGGKRSTGLASRHGQVQATVHTTTTLHRESTRHCLPARAESETPPGSEDAEGISMATRRYASISEGEQFYSTPRLSWGGGPGRTTSSVYPPAPSVPSVPARNRLSNMAYTAHTSDEAVPSHRPATAAPHKPTRSRIARQQPPSGRSGREPSKFPHAESSLPRSEAPWKQRHAERTAVGPSSQ